uniref:HRDC domain-containing protein n=1 Tax=Mycena chlorophos TaxID=658473 RepID=A0ABQ0LD46_MYCCL|nr:predicted protein [Mycena chlorophos]
MGLGLQGRGGFRVQILHRKRKGLGPEDLKLACWNVCGNSIYCALRTETRSVFTPPQKTSMQQHFLVNRAATSPPRGSRAPLARTTRENLHPAPIPPVPERPSEYWLKEPSWIDGARDPPLFFTNPAQIYETLYYYAPDHPHIDYYCAQAIAFLDAPRGGAGGSKAPLPASVSGNENLSESAASATPAASGAAIAAATDALASATSSANPNERAVNIIMYYIDHGKPTSYRSKSQPKLSKAAKYVTIDVAAATRQSLVHDMLKAHNIDDAFGVGTHSGPPFKISWTGSSGGKSAAPVIDTDADFKIIHDALLKKTGAAVLIEFNLTEMDGFRIVKKRALLTDDEDQHPESVHGTKVPRIDDFSIHDQMHGEMLLKLQRRWPCQTHKSENGDVGACYIDGNGNHIGLNMRKLKAWAAAIIAGDCTMHEPPNTAEFDGFRDGRSTRPRGRGSRTDAGAGDNTSSLLLAAMLPIFTSAAARVSGDPFRTPPRATATAECPPAPERPAVPAFSPIPARGQELHSCLLALRDSREVDLLDAEEALAVLDLTPDVIVDVPVPRLMEVTGAVEGKVYKLVAFCREWVARLEEKKRRIPLKF